MNEPSDLLQSIEACRVQRKISQYSIIKNSNMHKKTVQDIKSTKGNPRLDILCAYCTYVGAVITITPLNKKTSMRSVALGDITEAELLELGPEKLKDLLGRIRYLYETYY